MRLKNAVEAASGAAEELKAIVAHWTQPMSPAQQAEARKRLASWMMRGAISTVMVAVGRAGVKVSKAAIGKFNSTRKANVGEAPAPAATTCACATNRPVIIATGEKTLEQSDFALPGPIDLDWSRRYRSGDVHIGWFGQGWSHPLAVELLLGAQEHRYFDAQGRCVKLPVIGVGVEHFDAYEGMTFSRPDADHWTLTRKDGQTQTFVRPRDDIWRLPLAKLSDRVGRVVTMDYGPVPEDPFEPWYPRSLSDSAGRTLLLEWSRTHRLCAVVMLPNRLTNASIDDQPETLARYEYDTNGDLIRFIDANGGTRSYEWRNHVLTGYTLADGARFAAEYDVASPTGRVVRSWNVDTGEGFRFDYLDRARATRITDALNRRTLYEYDQRRDIIAITGPDGVRTETPFDANGHPRGSVDALGRETFYRFDDRGNLTQRVDPSGAKTTVAYNALDLPVRVTDALGHTWQRVYDDRGQFIELVDPLEQTTRYAYNENGQPVEITDARGGVKTLDWDQAGNLIGHTDCSGRSTRFTYDARGRLLTRTDALGHVTRHAWDGADRLVLSIEPTGAEHRYTWDGEGRLLSYIDPLGATTAYSYDGAGRAIQRQDAAGRTLRYAYDGAGRLAQLVNENGASTRFGYDMADNLVDEIGFDGRHQRYVYNAVAELTHVIETGGSDVGPGKVTRFERDVLGRLTRKSAQGDETCDARFDYDQLGRLTDANNPAAQIAFAYDPIGQLLCERQKLGGEASLLQHAYDPLGNRIATKLPDGRQLHWLFYGSGHLHQINIEKQGQHEVIVDIERNALHRETERTQGRLTSHFDHGQNQHDCELIWFVID